MKKDIYLCGIVHFDLEGPKRLKKVLKKIRPEIIAIEYDKRGAKEMIKEHQNCLKIIGDIRSGLKKLNNKFNKDLIKKVCYSLGYDVWIPKEYAKKKKVKFIFLENKKIVDKVVKDVSNYVEIELMKDFESGTEEFQKRMDKVYKEKSTDFGKKRDKIREKLKIVKRNKTFAKRIEKINGRILVLCGIEHIKGIEPNLKTLLAKYKPRVISLLSYK